MAITAVRVMPAAPEMTPGPGGRIQEVWRLTGDGSSTTYTLTPDFIKVLEAAIGDGFTNDLTTTTPAATSVLTFGTAPANGLTFDVLAIGRIN